MLNGLMRNAAMTLATTVDKGYKKQVPEKGCHHCNMCDKMESEARTHKRCSRCKVAYYCNAECQHKHWPIHRKGCVKADKSIR